MNYVVESYENYHEEERLTTNNARKIEYLTTIKVLDELLEPKTKVLDCAAGTGIYAFYLADKGFDVTATDITPRHIEHINLELKNKPYIMNTAVMDATNLSEFEDETFDIVLNMGPLYHLTEENMRDKCIEESVRVLKKGGLLFTAYISRYFVFPYVISSNINYLKSDLAKQLINTGVLRHDDPNCFWTDTYYASPDEIENYMKDNSLKIIDHFAQDSITPLIRKSIDSLNDEQFNIWFDYHYSVCREKSIIGASNHAIIVCKK